MDDPRIVHDIYGIAKVAAERQVKLEHFLGSGESAGASRANSPPA
jgi:hypothetical protein